MGPRLTRTTPRRSLRATAVSTRGFSLLELLVVVTIIGLFAGAAVLSMGVLGNDRDVEREAFRLQSLLNLLREESLMQSRDFGVLFSENGYRFYAYDYQQLKWVVPAEDELFVYHELGEPLSVELTVEDRELVLDFGDAAAAMGEDDESGTDGDDADEPEPQVMVLSSGEMSPFEASFYRDPAGGRFVLTAEPDGTIEVKSDGFAP